MEDLRNKDKTIVFIYNIIIGEFGVDFFEFPNFWGGDNFAIGLKKGSKLIYISTWDFRENTKNNMRYYSEFELIDEESLETNKVEECFNDITKEELVKKIKTFVRLNSQGV